MNTWSKLQTACVEPRPGRYLVNRRERCYVEAGCGRWRCKGCARRKRRRVVTRFVMLQPTHLVTLTIAGERGAPTLENLAWFHNRRRRLFRWMSRQRWGLVKQGWIPEVGEEHGRLHMHCAVKMRSRFLPYAKIQAAAKRLGLGIVDVEQAFRAEGAARYMAKYMAKGLDGTGLEGARRFGMSPGHNLPSNLDWSPAARADGLPVDDAARLVMVMDSQYKQYTGLAAPCYVAPSG